ncbi:MAG TPA: DUF3341 domain-containing protein [Candidatus Acidoferrales bacterium]|nr:DUF3341 domain-containing protein [Candidatus Acidoferrales bacterium]
MEHERSHRFGLLGEFESPKQLLGAAEKVRDAGYKHIDAYTPFPVEGLSEALGLKRNKVPLLTLIGGLCGGLGGFGFQYWVNVISYPQNIGGRPFNSWPAFIPVTFEMTILFASLTAVFGMLALNGLPQPHHPLFNAERFKMASTDRFFLCIESTDPKFHLADTAHFLQSCHAQHVTEVRDE